MWVNIEINMRVKTKCKEHLNVIKIDLYFAYIFYPSQCYLQAIRLSSSFFLCNRLFIQYNQPSFS